MPLTPPNLIAGGAIRPSRFVKVSTAEDFTVLEADANERTIGVAMDSTNYPPLDDVTVSANAAADGDHLKIHGPGEQCLLEAGDTIASGGLLKSDADGKGVPVATTGTTIQQIGAVALEDGADGELIRVFVLHYSERPALS